MYYLFRLATIIIPRLPRWFIRALSQMIGLIVWLVARNARRNATANMVHVLGTQVLASRAGRRQLRRTVRRMFQNNTRNYLEVFALPYIPAETILRNVQIDGIEHLEAALAPGKGVILVSIHLGPFDYIVQCASLKGYKVTIPVERLKDQRLLDLMLRLRRSHGVQILPLIGTSTMRTMIVALRQNQVVLITGDRAAQGQIAEKPFFGATARLPLGPLTLAKRTGAALIAGFCWRTSAEHIQAQLVPLSLALPQEERTNVDALMDSFIEKMEQFIKAHPEQWAMFVPLWTGDS